MPPPETPHVYVETSALLTWLFQEEGSVGVRAALEQADAVATSDLTLLEAERAIVRGEVSGRLAPDVARGIRMSLAGAAVGWTMSPVSDQVLRGARARFPVEPVRTLDAIHLATVTMLAAQVPGIAVVSLDDRVRKNAAALGFIVLP